LDFSLDEEQQMVRKLVRDFVEREVMPNADDWERSRGIPTDVFRRMGELGLMGLPFPEEYDGGGAGSLSYAIAVEELAKGSPSLALSYEAHVSLGSSPLAMFGTNEQKEKWLKPCARGEMLAAFGLTEPDAGSDAGGTRTTAVLDGDEWVLNGAKCFITNASVADIAVVTARTDEGKGTKGISAIVVPRGAPGFSIGTKYQKLGLRASDTAELVFEDCRVPASNLLGRRGEGFKQFLVTLDGGRVAIAALAVGMAQACLDASLRYAKERVQFGRPISKFQAIQFKLADMATETEVARLMVYKAAWLKDRGKPFSKEAAMAKLYASEAAVRAATQAVQIHGGYGYIDEYPVERFFRDVKLMEIGEGTSEIQRLVIARRLGC